VALVYERGSAFIETLEGTGFWRNRDIRPLPVDPQEFPYPNVDSINAALDIIEADNFKVVFIATQYVHAAVTIKLMQDRGMIGNYQIIGSDWLILGLESAFQGYGVELSSLHGIIGIRDWDDFTAPGMVEFRSKFEEWHINATGGDDFWSDKARAWTANAVDTVNATALALHDLLYTQGLDMNDLNASTILDNMSSRTIQGAFGDDLVFESNPKYRGQLANIRYSVASYNQYTGLFMDTGDWSAATGFTWKTDNRQQTYVTGTPFPAPDAFPPEPVEVISILNVTTTSFAVVWSQPDLKDGRNTLYRIQVTNAEDGEMIVDANTTETSIVKENLPKDTHFIVSITVYTNGGSSSIRSTKAQTNPDIESRDLSLISRASFAAVAGLLVIASLAFMVAVNKYKGHAVVKASSIPFLHVILTGSIIGYTAVVFNGIHSLACVATPIAISISFALMFSALLAKTWRVYKIFLSKSLSIKKIPNTKLAVFVMLYTAIELVLLAVWFIVDMPESILSQTEEDPFVYEYTCHTKYPSVWWATQLAPKLLLLSVGCILSFRVRNLSDNFNESRLIAFSLWNTFLMMGISLGVRQMITQQEVKYVVMAAGVLIIVGSTVFILFIPKFAAVYLGESLVNSGDTGVRNSGRSGGSKHSSSAQAIPLQCITTNPRVPSPQSQSSQS